MPDYRFGPSACPPDNTTWQERYEAAYNTLKEEMEGLWDVLPNFRPRATEVGNRIACVRTALDDLLKVCAE